MRFTGYLTAALLWPAIAAAHGDATDHLHPHGTVVVPYETLFVVAALMAAIGAIAILRNSDAAERISRTIRRFGSRR